MFTTVPELRRSEERPHAGHLCQVPERSAGGREIEVQKRDGLARSVHDVLGADIVVTEDRPALWVGHLIRPVQVCWQIELTHGFMVGAQQAGGACQRFICHHPGREQWNADVAFNPFEGPVAVCGLTDGFRCREIRRGQRREQRGRGQVVGAHGPDHRVALAENLAAVTHAAW